ncbi:hypothetical protein ACFSJ3_10080 [Corallincola platygyrae]|uniref:Transglutaminase domain-containing protein n=1 Tax=Corallincola platygyrae TaxID=1193278 RepID=A0ABW4XLF3_9GAMM
MRLIVLTIIGLISWSGLAQQLDASQTRTDNELKLNFSWLDRNQKKQNLGFGIPLDALKQQQQKSKAYRPQIADRHAYISLQKKAATYDHKQVQIKISQQPNALTWQVKSKDSDFEAKVRGALHQAAQEARQAYYQRNNYRLYESPWGETGVIPDHLHYMKVSVPAMKPLAKLIVERFPNAPARQVADYLLPFIQSIPYVTQDSRITSANLSYLPPLRVLEENRGDCDSKAVLLAAIMKAVYPQLSMAMIYMPNHAMLGLRMPYLETDLKVQDQGINYIVAEVAGPAQIRLASAGESSRNAILNGNYSVLPMP